VNAGQVKVNMTNYTFPPLFLRITMVTNLPSLPSDPYLCKKSVTDSETLCCVKNEITCDWCWMELLQNHNQMEIIYFLIYSFMVCFVTLSAS